MSDQDEQDLQRVTERIVARCRADAAFKQSLICDFAGTLRQEGLALPADLSDAVRENLARVLQLPIPANRIDLSDERLAGVAAGSNNPRLQ